MRPWELVSLELDDYAEIIGEYFEKLGMPIRRVKSLTIPICSTKRHEKKGVCEIVEQALGEGDERKLVLYGHGGCHHFTYGLCKHTDRFSEDYAYVHFDHHDDSFQRGDGSLSCGAFVADILDDTHASVALYVGSYGSPNQLCITEKDLRKERSFLRSRFNRFFLRKPFKKFESGLESLPQDVYLSFDLDVMSHSFIPTGYDQGSLRLKELMRCIDSIKKTKQIIGADVLGYTGNDRKAYGMWVYKRIVASLMDA